MTSAIPTYSMQTALLPKGVVESIEKMNRRFLWGGNEDKRALHLVNWDSVCKPVAQGGLGIRRMDFSQLGHTSKNCLEVD